MEKDGFYYQLDDDFRVEWSDVEDWLVANVVWAQATDHPVPEYVVVQTLVGSGRHDPDAVRDALTEAVERGDVEHVEDGYRPGEWDEYQPAGAK